MSFQGANLPLQFFVDNYGNTERNYEVFNFVSNTSAANTKIRLSPDSFLIAPGKKRKVKMNYFPILCDTEGSCSTSLCDAGEVVEPAQREFDITRCYASKIYALQKEDVRLVDNQGWNYEGIARAIMTSAMPQIRRDIAIDYTTELYQKAGIFPDGNAQKRVSVTNPATGIVNPIGREQIELEYLDAGFMKPFMYGSSELYYWKSMVNIGGLNAQGQFVNRVDVSNVYYDSGLSKLILNDNPNGGHILTIAPEVFKHVWYLNNAGIFRTDVADISQIGNMYFRGYDGFAEGVFIDPISGLAFDLYINYDKCNQVWTWQVKHNYELIVLPDVACNDQGVNGLFHWRTCPTVIADCPTGVTPSPAVNPTTYSWTPGGIFPLVAYQVTIGGVSLDLTSGTQNGQTVSSLAQMAALLNDVYNSGDTLFTVNGSTIRYSGYNALTGSINGGDITITFA